MSFCSVCEIWTIRIFNFWLMRIFMSWWRILCSSEFFESKKANHQDLFDHCFLKKFPLHFITFDFNRSSIKFGSSRLCFSIKKPLFLSDMVCISSSLSQAHWYRKGCEKTFLSPEKNRSESWLLDWKCLGGEIFVIFKCARVYKYFRQNFSLRILKKKKKKKKKFAIWSEVELRLTVLVNLELNCFFYATMQIGQ